MSMPKWLILSTETWSITVINQNEERFFASESLQGTLTPDLLEGRSTAGSFALIAGDQEYELHSYDEGPAGVTMIFNCSADMLPAILDTNVSGINLRCGKNEITRDLSRYEISWDIIRIGSSNYKVTLSFSKNQAGIING